jgi:hypothetical protein
LPAAQVGTAVMSDDGRLFAGSLQELEASLDSDRVRFHRGRIGGALARIKAEP